MIVVTGASGALGRLVIEDLLTRVPAEQLRAAVRSPEKVQDLAERGVDVRRADYDEPSTLRHALEGADKVLLISGSEVGRRFDQHKAVVEAAQQAGVKHLAYTSVVKADTTTVFVAPEHKATEELIRASGLPFTFLRNGWYNENHAAPIAEVATTGVLRGSAHDGRVASAARADYAAAAAVVLTEEGHEGKVYELTGDVAWTFPDLVAEVGRLANRETRYEDLTEDEYAKALAEAGVSEQLIGYLLVLDQAVASQDLGETSGELRALIGRPTTPIGEYVAEVLASRD
jgi:NAD(P)H dehydrogenase (quinone)